MPATTGKMPVIVYHAAWWKDVLTPTMIDYSAITHLIIFPAQSVSTVSPYFNAGASPYDLNLGGDLAAIVTNAHAHGCKVILSVVGGYGEGNMPESVAGDATKSQTFVNAAVAYMVAHNCDGIEMDWEFPNSGDATGWHNLITKFRTALDALTPHGILITSGYYSVLGNPPYVTADMNANVDFVVPMSYTMWMGAGSGPYKSGYDTPVNLPTQWSGYAGYSLSDPADGGPLTYLTDGYTPSKVAVSISFEGTQFSGVSGMGQAYSSYNFCSTVSKCLGSYAVIPASGRAWDDVAKAAYCISGGKVYSYQTTQSVTGIVDWARAQGFGAIMIYDLGAGYEATPGTPDPQALLHAVAAAASGSSGPSAPTGTFSASPSSLPSGGGSTTLTWTSSGATSASIDQGIGSVALSGSTTLTITSSKTYTLTLTNATGTTTYSTTVTVAAPAPPTGTLTASPTSLPYGGGTSTLTWTSSGATSASLDNGIGSVALSGSTSVTIDASKTYTLTLTNATGTTTYSATVTVSTTPPAPTGTFSASPTTLSYGGGSSTLTWTSSNATSASIDNGVGSVAVNGSTSVSLSTTTTYHITLTGAGGTHTYAATVTVGVQPKPTGTFTATPSSLALGGGDVTLEWTSSGATSASINNGIGSVATSGSQIVSVTSTKTFTISLTNAAGTTTYSVTVTVATPAPTPTATISASSTSLPYGGGSTTLTWVTTNATSVTLNGLAISSSSSQVVVVAATTTYTIVATNSDGVTASSSVTVSVATTPPVVRPTGTLVASPTSLPYGGGTVTLTWTSFNATSATLNGAAVVLNGSMTTSTIVATMTYTLVLINANGNATYTATVTVASPPPVNKGEAIYTDSFQNGWNTVRSWAVKTSNVANPAASGTSSLKVVTTAWNSLQFGKGTWGSFPAFSPTQYTNFVFSVYCAKAVTIQASAYTAANQKLSVVSKAVPAGKWTTYTIPIASLVGTKSYISVELSTVGVASTYYLDNVQMSNTITLSTL